MLNQRLVQRLLKSVKDSILKGDHAKATFMSERILEYVKGEATNHNIISLLTSENI